MIRVCNGKYSDHFFLQNELCVAFGPGKDMFDSTRIIGEKQYSLGKVTEYGDQCFIQWV